MTEVIHRPAFTLLSSIKPATVRAEEVCALCSPMPTVALVVDDSMLIRYTVCRFLEERGFTVESATNGVEALQVLARVTPDLIVTDMQMPKMSGSELLSELKSKPETATIPVIIVAGRGSGFDETEKRADFAIFKDIDIESQLEKALSEVLGEAGRKLGAGK
jgi:CheY-like chemotaxis protein